MDYIYVIALGIGSTLGFFFVYRNFEMYREGRCLVLFVSGIILLGFYIFVQWNTIYLEQDQAITELLRYLSFQNSIGSGRETGFLLLGYLLIIWACLGIITNRILKVKKTNRQ